MVAQELGVSTKDVREMESRMAAQIWHLICQMTMTAVILVVR